MMNYQIKSDFRVTSKATGKRLPFRKGNLSGLPLLLCFFGLFSVSCELSQEHAIEPKTEEIEVQVLNDTELQTRSGEPVANFVLSCSTCYTNTTITFTNLSVNATSYRWDFGDGNTSTDPNPTHTYSCSDTYTITLIASDGDVEDDYVVTEEIIDT